MSDPIPADAQEALYIVLAQPNITIVKSYVSHDLANLRWAFPSDPLFARAIEATAKEILRALKSPATFGRMFEHDLGSWRRSSYHSRPEREADLRLIFRPQFDGDGIDIIGFGRRHLPDTTSIYRIVANRLKRV